MQTAAEALNSLLHQLSKRPAPAPSSSPLTRRARPFEGCTVCGGAGFVVPDLAYTDPSFGKLVRCAACTNYLATCRLTAEEQRLTVDDLTDRPEDTQGYLLAMRFLAKAMLGDPYGFLSVAGVKGAGKSLISAALVASFARSGREAVYYTASEITSKLMDWDARSDDIPGDPMQFCERLKRASVLAIDEIDKVRWTQWVVRTLGDVLDWRHRHVERQVTILTMNLPPEQWPCEAGVYIEHIASRLRDGRFHRYWPAEFREQLPACLTGFYDVDGQGQQHHYAPGLLLVDLPDARPGLRR